MKTEQGDTDCHLGGDFPMAAIFPRVSHRHSWKDNDDDDDDDERNRKFRFTQWTNPEKNY